MARLRKSFLPVALIASLLHGMVLTGCGGGGSSSTGPSGGAEVKMKFTGLVPARSLIVGARSTSVGGANVLVDGVAVGVTDANGEIVLQLAPGTHTITVESGGVTSTPFAVTVAEGDAVTLEVELEKDGTLVVEQDRDHDGDYDDADELDDDEDDDDEADQEDEDEDEDSDDDEEEHSNGTVAIQ